VNNIERISCVTNRKDSIRPRKLWHFIFIKYQIKYQRHFSLLRGTSSFRTVYQMRRKTSFLQGGDIGAGSEAKGEMLL